MGESDGIHISDSTFHGDNIAIGPHARATKNTYGAVPDSKRGAAGKAAQPAAAGRKGETAHSKVFISYSHKDKRWLERLQVHLKPLEHRGLVEVWDDTRIRVGTIWKEELQTAIESASIVVLIVSADFLASDFIATYELPRLLSQAATTGAVIMPVIVGPCLFNDSVLHIYQAINAPSKPLSVLSNAASESVLVKLAEAILKVIDEASEDDGSV